MLLKYAIQSFPVGMEFHLMHMHNYLLQHQVTLLHFLWHYFRVVFYFLSLFGGYLMNVGDVFYFIDQICSTLYIGIIHLLVELGALP